MATKTVRLNETVYERIAAQKRDDETFNEAIDRLTQGRSLLDLAGIFSDAEASTLRAAIQTSEQAAYEDIMNKS